MKKIHIIGGGLSGSEAAWQAVNMGVSVILHEMRPTVETPAHHTVGSLGLEDVGRNASGPLVQIHHNGSGRIQPDIRRGFIGRTHGKVAPFSKNQGTDGPEKAGG